MKTVHNMRINWPEGVDKDECIETLVENILARFPDAAVLSAPVDVGEENINGLNLRWIEQKFTSDLFDTTAHMTIGMIVDELYDMRDSLTEEDSPFGKEESEFVSSVLNAVIDHLAHKFLGEDCDHS